MACAFEPFGLIGDKWREMGGEHGVFGCPTSGEYDVPGRSGKRQDFANGQIAWSPDQGQQMLVWCYPEGDHVRFAWGPTQPFSYDFFIVRWAVGGDIPVGTDKQEDIHSGGADGYFTVSIPMDQIGSDGRHAGFTFIVEGCDGSFLGGADCRQGWTIPVGLRA
jgi:hypothetical protein